MAAAPPRGVDTSAHPVLPSRYVAVQLLCEVPVAEVMRNNPAAVAMAAELTQAVGSQLSMARPDRSERCMIVVIAGGDA